MSYKITVISILFLLAACSPEKKETISEKNQHKNWEELIDPGLSKWGEKKWGYRKSLLKDSGILYHSIGPMAVEYWRSWMLSQEFQMMEGHTGDFWSQANSAIEPMYL